MTLFRLESPLELEPLGRSPSVRDDSGSGLPKREAWASAIAMRISCRCRRRSLAAAAAASAASAASAAAAASAVAAAAAAFTADFAVAVAAAADVAAISAAAIAATATAVSDREVSSLRSSSHPGVLPFLELLPIDGWGCRLGGYASPPFMRPCARCGPV